MFAKLCFLHYFYIFLTVHKNVIVELIMITIIINYFIKKITQMIIKGKVTQSACELTIYHDDLINSSFMVS